MYLEDFQHSGGGEASGERFKDKALLQLCLRRFVSYLGTGWDLRGMGRYASSFARAQNEHRQHLREKSEGQDLIFYETIDKHDN